MKTHLVVNTVVETNKKQPQAFGRLRFDSGWISLGRGPGHVLWQVLDGNLMPGLVRCCSCCCCVSVSVVVVLVIVVAVAGSSC
jgi:hypothetical protein